MVVGHQIYIIHSIVPSLKFTHGNSEGNLYGAAVDNRGHTPALVPTSQVLVQHFIILSEAYYEHH